MLVLPSFSIYVCVSWDRIQQIYMECGWILLNFFFPLSLVFYYRQAWASNIDLRDPRFLAFAAAQHQFLQSDYEEYSIESSGAFAYFRMVVIAVSLILFVL